MWVLYLSYFLLLISCWISSKLQCYSRGLLSTIFLQCWITVYEEYSWAFTVVGSGSDDITHYCCFFTLHLDSYWSPFGICGVYYSLWWPCTVSWVTLHLRLLNSWSERFCWEEYFMGGTWFLSWCQYFLLLLIYFFLFFSEHNGNVIWNHSGCDFWPWIGESSSALASHLSVTMKESCLLLACTLSHNFKINLKPRLDNLFCILLNSYPILQTQSAFLNWHKSLPKWCDCTKSYWIRFMTWSIIILYNMLLSIIAIHECLLK